MRILDCYAPTLVCVMIALGSSSASATSVVLLTQDRSISASASGCGPDPEGDPNGVCGSDSDSDAAVGFDVFDSSVSASAPNGSGFASQLSTLTSSLISASVHTTASGDSFPVPYSGSGDAGSVFRISFSATEATPYVIQGSLLTRGGPTGSYGSVSISLLDSEGGELLGINCPVGFGGPCGEFTNSGTLAPGEYLLEAVAISRGQKLTFSGPPEVGTADFSFEFTIVPEPSTVASLGLGLALLGLRNGKGRARRRREAGRARSSEVTQVA